MSITLPEIESTDQARETHDALEHQLQPFFPALARFESTKELAASELYTQLYPEIERVLNAVVQENFAPEVTSQNIISHQPIRATAWNIERGKQLRGIIRTLREHPILTANDLFLLTELDYGMARTNNAFVAREIGTGIKTKLRFRALLHFACQGKRHRSGNFRRKPTIIARQRTLFASQNHARTFARTSERQR
ncbi:MAG: hypothetical protein NVSMB56_04980 [Pyrinomonadaceae bacterium]